MKKSFLKLALAVLTVGLLGSCSKINERLDNLDKRVDAIENEQIASINSQIDGIKTSIADLGTIRSDINSLKQSASDHSIDIFNLEEADRALKDRIVNLEDYVDAVLPNYAEKEWVEATFSTLEQYEATCDTIAKIDARIGALDAKLSKDIKATADSLTKWVNKQFEGYYTAAEMDAKLAQMKAAVDSAKASGGITDAKADSIATELTNAKAAVDTAKANIRAEYRAAIDTAIKTSEGKLTKELTDAISEVNGKIESLTTRVGNLETSVNNLLGRVKALEEMIQSVVIVPAYSDGSVEAVDGILELNLVVSPLSAAKGLTKDNVKILLNKVATKAVSVDTVKTENISSFIVDETNGTVEIKVDISENLPTEDGQALTVAVSVANGISDFTTEFVPVTRPVSVSLDKHSIVVQSPDSDKDTTLTATVKNSTKGVSWTSLNTNIATVDNAGKVTIKANVIGKDTIVVKTVEGNATDTCFVKVLPKGALAGEFSVSATKQVYFSKGNLWADGDNALHFEANQYSYASSWNASHVSHFTWSNTVAAAVGNNNSGDYLFCDESHKVSVDGGEAIYYALSKDEWTYLFNNHSKKWATVNGVNGYVIAPDGFTGELASSYADDAALASAGNLVFLPAAGSREGSGFELVGDRGEYWSSTASGISGANDLSFRSDNVNLDRSVDRSSGFSLRLITESK